MKKTLIALIAAVLVLGGVYALLSTGALEKSEPREDTEPAAEETQVLSYNIPVTFIKATGEEALTFERKGAEWTCAEFPDYPMDGAELTEMGEFLSKLKAKRTLPEKKAAFGLDAPSCEILFRLSDGTENVLYLGAKIAATGDRYAYLRGAEDVIFTVDGESSDKFYKTAFEHVLIYELPEVKTDRIKSVTVNGKPAKNAAGVVSAVNSLYFSYCENAYAEDLSKYGLSPAKYEITTVYLDDMDAELTFTLSIGAEAGEKYTCASVGALPNTVYACFNMGVERLLEALEG
ncbi:MAG: DUF4340 domain-containing protein [Clostridia bacterium]|nr:DUF4340 domain-containing protein [Clostridia bacterium]